MMIYFLIFLGVVIFLIAITLYGYRAVFNAFQTGLADMTKSIVNTTITMAKPNLQTFVKYAKVELTPPMPTEIGQIGKDVANIFQGAKSGQWKQTTVKEVWLNALVATEIVFWFYFGECIGKMHLVGYKVKE